MTMVNISRIGNLTRSTCPCGVQDNIRYHHHNDILQDKHRKVNTCTCTMVQQFECG